MSDHGHQEIIIIKRGNMEEEGHHGGAWKIAFADFMTAMMALFLVLWLINAANEETKRAVASYFNPIKLVDRNRSQKGIEEQKGGPTTTDQTGGSPAPESQAEDKLLQTNAVKVTPTPAAANSGSEKDQAFFADPMAALDRIEASVLERQGISNKIENKGENAMPGKFSDPFNSGYWDAQDGNSKTPVEGAKPDESADETAKHTAKANPDIQHQEPAEKDKPKAEKSIDPASEKIELTIREEIDKTLGGEAAIKDAIKVTKTDKGTLIQITDTPDAPMFDIGAAVPMGETILAINAVAKALEEQEGAIHVYGHTDGRQYEGTGNRNWRLSLDRAQAVYFMLLRAGLKETRFSQVTGFADRKPLDAKDPLADRNRRIEIFLERP